MALLYMPELVEHVVNASNKSIAVIHLHRTRSPHICETQRQEIVDDPCLIAARREGCQYSGLALQSGTSASIYYGRTAAAQVCEHPG